MTSPPYAFLIHEIIEQTLSVKTGAKIYSRFEDLCDGDVTPERVLTLSTDDIKSIGTSVVKATYILGITQAIHDGLLNLGSLSSMNDADVISTLTKQHGIGKWTAKMYLMFVLDRQDILPIEDVAFLQGYGWAYNTSDYSPHAVRKNVKNGNPIHQLQRDILYRALDGGYTKEEFHLCK